MDKKLKISLTILAVVLCLFLTGAENYDTKQANKDIAAGNALVQKISTIDVLAPLSAVSLSPFFGITLLSGASLLGQHDILPTNSFLQTNSVLANPLIFVVFLLLSGITSIPKLTTPTKAVAETADILERYAGIIVYAIVIASNNLTTPPEQVAVVYHAGIISFTANTFLIIAATCNIIVVNTVKFFFELLALISPIPFLDAIFEAANKTICGVLVAIYLYNPFLAFMLNLVLFLICLMIYRWVYRRVLYLKAILLEPIIMRLLKIKDPLKRYRSKYQILNRTGNALAKVFPLRKFENVKKKQFCILFQNETGYEIMTIKLFKAPTLIEAESISPPEVGLIRSTTKIKLRSQEDPIEFAFAKHYNNNFEPENSPEK